MKKFDADYRLLADMYDDGLFPDFLADKIKALLQGAIALLESGKRIWKL